MNVSTISYSQVGQSLYSCPSTLMVWSRWKYGA